MALSHALSSRRSRFGTAALVLLALLLSFLPSGAATAAPASPAPAPTPSTSASPAAHRPPDRHVKASLAGHRRAPVCGRPGLGRASCSAVHDLNVSGPLASSSSVPAGYGPTDLQNAYNLPSGSKGAGVTVAVVVAYDNPAAEQDLQVYRSKFGLPACDAGCFRKVDQNGGTTYPTVDTGWALESSLDLDMVSAACPLCNILLVEANSNSLNDLGAAVNTAAALGASVINNSYGGDSSSYDPQFDAAYFNHPGVAITASSGDNGYGAEYPAASPLVTAVGGTSLQPASTTRGWSEQAWSGAGSGCAAAGTKPAWQKDSGCGTKTVSDVSAVADPATGLAVYDSTPDSGMSGWQVLGGTSASSPLIAGVYALAGPAAAADPSPASFPYARPSALNDVAYGSNGSCATAYLCAAAPGYDGPTGLGTPNGATAFTTAPVGSLRSAADVVTVDSQGGVQAYSPPGDGTLGSPRPLWLGIADIKSVHVTDWNADGNADLLLQTNGGQLWLLLGNADGSIQRGQELASSGWDQLQLAVGKWITGSAYPQILALSPAGDLTEWANESGAAALGPSRPVASGMVRMNATMLDFDGDGNQDLLVKDNMGLLLLYRSDGAGNLVSEDRAAVGQGWNTMSEITPSQGFQGAGTQGLLARSTAGSLLYYPASNSKFGQPLKLGGGWGSTLVSGGQALTAQRPIVSAADTVWADSAGRLFNSAATGSGSVNAPFQIGVGFTGMKSAHVTDWNNDGFQDLVVQWNTGKVNVYLGRTTGFASGPVLASSGWSGVDFTAGRWVKGYAYPGFVGTNSAGNLYYWRNVGGSSLAAAVKIGQGWGGLKVNMVDFDGDGNQDVLARYSDGSMRLFRSNGSNGFINETRQVVGSGWQGTDSVGAVGGFTGPGSKGLVARASSSGELYYYPVVAHSSWGSRLTLGSGWSGRFLAN